LKFSCNLTLTPMLASIELGIFLLYKLPFF